MVSGRIRIESVGRNATDIRFASVGWRKWYGYDNCLGRGQFVADLSATRENHSQLNRFCLPGEHYDLKADFDTVPPIGTSIHVVYIQNELSFWLSHLSAGSFGR